MSLFSLKSARKKPAPKDFLQKIAKTIAVFTWNAFIIYRYSTNPLRTLQISSSEWRRCGGGRTISGGLWPKLKSLDPSWIPWINLALLTNSRQLNLLIKNTSDSHAKAKTSRLIFSFLRVYNFIFVLFAVHYAHYYTRSDT